MMSQLTCIVFLFGGLLTMSMSPPVHEDQYVNELPYEIADDTSNSFADGLTQDARVKVAQGVRSQKLEENQNVDPNIDIETGAALEDQSTATKDSFRRLPLEPDRIMQLELARRRLGGIGSPHKVEQENSIESEPWNGEEVKAALTAGEEAIVIFEQMATGKNYNEFSPIENRINSQFHIGEDSHIDATKPFEAGPLKDVDGGTELQEEQGIGMATNDGSQDAIDHQRRLPYVIRKLQAKHDQKKPRKISTKTPLHQRKASRAQQDEEEQENDSGDFIAAVSESKAQSQSNKHIPFNHRLMDPTKQQRKPSNRFAHKGWEHRASPVLSELPDEIASGDDDEERGVSGLLNQVEYSNLGESQRSAKQRIHTSAARNTKKAHREVLQKVPKRSTTITTEKARASRVGTLLKRTKSRQPKRGVSSAIEDQEPMPSEQLEVPSNGDDERKDLNDEYYQEASRIAALRRKYTAEMSQEAIAAQYPITEDMAHSSYVMPENNQYMADSTVDAQSGQTPHIYQALQDHDAIDFDQRQPMTKDLSRGMNVQETDRPSSTDSETTAPFANFQSAAADYGENLLEAASYINTDSRSMPLDFDTRELEDIQNSDNDEVSQQATAAQYSASEITTNPEEVQDDLNEEWPFGDQTTNSQPEHSHEYLPRQEFDATGHKHELVSGIIEEFPNAAMENGESAMDTGQYISTEDLQSTSTDLDTGEVQQETITWSENRDEHALGEPALEALYSMPDEVDYTNPEDPQDDSEEDWSLSGRTANVQPENSDEYLSWQVLGENYPKDAVKPGEITEPQDERTNDVEQTSEARPFKNTGNLQQATSDQDNGGIVEENLADDMENSDDYPNDVQSSTLPLLQEANAMLDKESLPQRVVVYVPARNEEAAQADLPEDVQATSSAYIMTESFDPGESTDAQADLPEEAQATSSAYIMTESLDPGESTDAQADLPEDVHATLSTYITTESFDSGESTGGSDSKENPYTTKLTTCMGTTIAMDISKQVANEVQSHVKWSKDGHPIEQPLLERMRYIGQDSNCVECSLEISEVSTQDDGTYVAVLEANPSVSLQHTFILKVLDTHLLIKEANPKLADLHDDVIIRAQANYNGNAQWTFYNGSSSTLRHGDDNIFFPARTDYQVEDGSVLLIKGVQLHNLGEYRVDIEKNGCHATGMVRLELKPSVSWKRTVELLEKIAAIKGNRSEFKSNGELTIIFTLSIIFTALISCLLLAIIQVHCHKVGRYMKKRRYYRLHKDDAMARFHKTRRTKGKKNTKSWWSSFMSTLKPLRKQNVDGIYQDIYVTTQSDSDIPTDISNLSEADVYDRKQKKSTHAKDEQSDKYGTTNSTRQDPTPKSQHMQQSAETKGNTHLKHEDDPSSIN